jgi:cytohesin
MDSFFGASMANLSIDDRLQLLSAIIDDSSEDSGLESDENEEGTGDGSEAKIVSHQAAIFVMDSARRFVQNQPLVNAAIRGDMALLRSLLQQPMTGINTKDGIGETALFAAVCHDQLEAATLLLESNADPNINCSNSWTALHAVARSGNRALATLLLSWNADTAVVDTTGWSPLHVSSLYGTNAIAEILLDANANPNARANDDRTALHTAVDYGHRDVIQTLFRHNAELDIKDDEGRTPLHIAAMERPFPPPVSLLLDLGATAGLVDKKGYTALHMAVTAGHDPDLAVGPLLLHGASADMAAFDGWTPLLLAIQYIDKPGNHRAAILNTLIETNTVDINRVWPISGERITPLLLAIEVRSQQAVEILIRHGANVKLAGEQEGKPITPVLKAAACYDPEEPKLLQALFNAGIDPREKMQFGITLTHIAALKGNIESLELLLEHNVDVNAADERGGTPLHLAARNSNPDCVSLLLQHGANVNAKAIDRSTPLHNAAKEMDEESIRLLLDAGADTTVRLSGGGMQSPVDFVRERFRTAENEQLRGRYRRILLMMMERVAERDPQLREVISDTQQGWLREALYMQPPVENNERPQGITVAEMRRRYQGS